MSTFIGNHDLPRIIHLAANNRLWGDNQAADGKDLAWSGQPGAVAEHRGVRARRERASRCSTRTAARRSSTTATRSACPARAIRTTAASCSGRASARTRRSCKDRLAKLGDIRSKHPALRRGTRTTLESNADVWAYSRDHQRRHRLRRGQPQRQRQARHLAARRARSPSSSPAPPRAAPTSRSRRVRPAFSSTK